MKSEQHLLDVSVIAIAFRPGMEAAETFRTALALDPHAQCWAIVSPELVASIRSQWHDESGSALLIVRSPAESCAEVACELLSDAPPGALAVLLANLPAQPRLLGIAVRNGAGPLVRRLEAAHEDVQVHLYRADWQRRPPRIR